MDCYVLGPHSAPSGRARCPNIWRLTAGLERNLCAQVLIFISAVAFGLEVYFCDVSVSIMLYYCHGPVSCVPGCYEMWNIQDVSHMISEVCTIK